MTGTISRIRNIFCGEVRTLLRLVHFNVEGGIVDPLAEQLLPKVHRLLHNGVWPAEGREVEALRELGLRRRKFVHLIKNIQRDNTSQRCASDQEYPGNVSFWLQ